MLEAGDQIDEFIWWEPRSGTSNTWEDNWTRIGSVKALCPNLARPNISEDPSFFIQPKGWDIEKIQEHLPGRIVDNVLRKLKMGSNSTCPDHPWWMKTSSGKFTVESNPGEGSVALRDENGGFIYDKARRLGVTSSLDVEAVAIKRGIEYCVEQLRIPVLIEYDSLGMIDILERKWKIPWSISMAVRRIEEWRNKGLVHLPTSLEKIMH
ncbi:hypothetical protein HAX54_030140 [Datura stramonium]|uniref:RNase H type-1 domain-containing protein n=1 Tax=Datura stramonium TaxID=4076 RepID=A0ABS8V9J3_DATST|nr:hypothetical protein [Datura stramonium]